MNQDHVKTDVLFETGKIRVRSLLREDGKRIDEEV
jgi:hypothetical protein